MGLVRALVLWLGVRAGVAVLGGISLVIPAQLGVIAIVTALGLADQVRLGEDLLLANLGISLRARTALTAVVPIVFETAIALGAAGA